MGGPGERALGAWGPEAGPPAPQGEERSVELAVLGRLASEMEYEVLHLLERYG